MPCFKLGAGVGRLEVRGDIVHFPNLTAPIPRQPDARGREAGHAHVMHVKLRCSESSGDGLVLNKTKKRRRCKQEQY